MNTDRINRFAQRIRGRFFETIQTSPVEIALSFIFFVLGSLCINDTSYGYMRWEFVSYFPAFFFLAYALNRFFPKGAVRIFYWLSAAAWAPFWWIEPDIPVYIASLVCTVLLAMASGMLTDNDAFIHRVVKIVRDFFFALLLCSVAFLLILSIYYSFMYIFDLVTYGFDFIEYASLFTYVVASPLIFLMFNTGEQQKWHPGKFLDILFNYIVSPAVLVYTLILYVYFIKIAAAWELPKGNIAWMVIAFITVATIAKACQSLLDKQPYRFFYNQLSLLAIPPLAMFWIGALYRVSQYGFTQERVYLVLCGVALTLFAVMFLSRKYGKYLYLSLLLATMAAVFTYIPGITAADLGIDSQSRRLRATAEKLNILTPEGKLLAVDNLDVAPADTTLKEEYKKLYEAFRYVANHHQDGSRWKKHDDSITGYMQTHFGIADTDELFKKIIPTPWRSDIQGWGEYGYDIEGNPNYTLRLVEDRLTVEGFRELYWVSSEGPIHYSYSSDSLKIYREGCDTLFEGSVQEMFTSQISKTEISTLPWTSNSLEQHADLLLNFDTDSSRIIFEYVQLDTLSGEISDINVGYYLVR